MSSALLETVGARVRALRERHKLSRRALSERCGVSERFLAQLESGHGNISLARFAEVAAALETTPAELLADVGGKRASRIALLGVRGAGKSTVGAKLAKKLRAELIEIDREIERAAGLRLAEIFELHGEAYYRRVERAVLARLLDGTRPVVLATGGSIVNDAESFALLRERAHTVWLRARAEDHWSRVIAQGDSRPMADRKHAFAELRALLAAREPLYATAHQVVDTSDRTVDEVVAQISS